MATRAYPQQVETAWGLSAFGAVSSSGAADATVRAAKPFETILTQLFSFLADLDAVCQHSSCSAADSCC